MPIFVYEPIPPENASDSYSPRECCFFETLQWSNEAPMTQCPECGAPIRRAVTGFSLATRVQKDPLRDVAKTLGDGILSGQADVSADDKKAAGGIISGPSSETAAGRAARMAYKHVCSGNCRH
jgi:predicted nucleic acid-binding Zn ribbon protein